MVGDTLSVLLDIEKEEKVLACKLLAELSQAYYGHLSQAYHEHPSQASVADGGEHP